ncbi:MAG: hypothetical protein FWD52_09450 [Candidatus Bathyarchaeota archaeon]|nr:hypothetical protein [Candidatus Termiticorpusculum sp.]
MKIEKRIIACIIVLIIGTAAIYVINTAPQTTPPEPIAQPENIKDTNINLTPNEDNPNFVNTQPNIPHINNKSS